MLVLNSGLSPCLSLSGARIRNQSAKKARSTREPSADALNAAARKQGLRTTLPFVSRDRPLVTQAGFQLYVPEYDLN